MGPEPLTESTQMIVLLISGIAIGASLGSYLTFELSEKGGLIAAAIALLFGVLVLLTSSTSFWAPGATKIVIPLCFATALFALITVLVRQKRGSYV